MVSNDGGARWANRAVGAREALERVFCRDERHVVICGNGAAFASDDAGKSFRRLGDVEEIAVSGPLLLGIKRAERFGKEHILCQWTDGPAGWAPIGTTPPRAKAFAASGDAMILAAEGGIYRSTDGVAWELAHATDACLRAVHATVLGRAAVVGYHGFLSWSDDAGRTWTEERSHTDRNLEGVWVTSAGEVWAVGKDGVVVRSGNGAPIDGVVQPPPARAEARRASVPPAPPAAGKILREASAPPSWQPPEGALPPVHLAAVTAATFVGEDRVVTGDAAGRVVVSARGEDGRWSEAGEVAMGDPPARIDALAACGDVLFVASGGRLVRLDLRRGARTDGTAVEGPQGVTHLAARAGRLAAAGPRGVSIVRIVDGGTEIVRSIDLAGGEVTDLDLSYDGRAVVVVGGKAVRVYDGETGELVGRFQRAQAHVRFAREADHLYLAGDRYDLRKVAASKGGGRHEVRTREVHRAIVASPDAGILALVSNHDILQVVETSGETLLLGWKATPSTTLTGAPRVLEERELAHRTFSRHRISLTEHAAITALAASDGGCVVAGDVSGEVAVFEARTLEAQRLARPSATRVQPALGRPLIDGRVIAAGRAVGEAWALFLGADGQVREVDPATGEVRAGPPIDVAGSLTAIGPTLLVDTVDGLFGLDRATGARMWSASFPVSGPRYHRGALYGFERRSSYAVGARVSHRLLRLDPPTGAVTEVVLGAPPGAADAAGFAGWLTPTARGLLSAFEDAGGEWLGVLIDPSTGTVERAPLQVQGSAPIPQLLRGGATAGPLGRYLLWEVDHGECVIRDGHDPALGVVASPRLELGTTPTPLVESQRIVAMDPASHSACVLDLDGKLVARMSGLGSALHTMVFAGPEGRAFVTWAEGMPVHRWPLP
jgi:hypothetical protein